ncbi:MAG: bifunctional methylenetetrahydrofolate dehydrogenase/methenyltetrahydrofolate cyclohydrolase FolD [Alphaproteobacteria bacterium]|nr:bifunctional methylenetetrahydrofolate dehydrogenase/methenyltetrahydrofolate cyclohydrolase FolD [Alphaproteobacteria bacterium]
MNPKIIDGKSIAQTLCDDVKQATTAFIAESGIVPRLDVIIVGEDPASRVYVANKQKRAESIGFKGGITRLPVTTSQADLLAAIREKNADPAVHGILVQLPLPAHIDEHLVIQTIAAHKDVDGFHFDNVARLATGTGGGYAPCTPAGCMHLLRTVEPKLDGAHAVVVGRSNIVGKPMGALLLAANCTVTMAHSRTKDLADMCRSADVLVAAVGRPEMLPGDWVKKDAIVIDVGINRTSEGRLVGDVHFDSAIANARAITPVPGGVGPMTIAFLMANTLDAAQKATATQAAA